MKKATDPKKKGGKADLPPPEPEPELVEEEVEEVNPIDLMKTLREELRLKEVQGTRKYYFWVYAIFLGYFCLDDYHTKVFVIKHFKTEFEEGKYSLQDWNKGLNEIEIN